MHLHRICIANTTKLDHTLRMTPSTLKDDVNLQQIAALGEGQAVEFKESPAKLDREIVALANASGGTIYCGISDQGKIIGTEVNNRVISQIQDIARNCDPSIEPLISTIKVHHKNVLKITISEGSDKPYQCSAGVFLRIGPNTQKLKIREVKELLNKNSSFFDGRLNRELTVKRGLVSQTFKDYCRLANIQAAPNVQPILENLLAAGKVSTDNQLYLTNAGVLLFSQSPRKFIPESYLTAVRYNGVDKFSVNDRQEFSGDLLSQIEGGLQFVKRHISVTYEIGRAAKREELYQYPLVAVREALINALVHRDYTFQNSCVYLNIFSDRLEIENPGGIFSGISPDEIEGRSLRRNPVLADLLYRAGYGEKLGSGITRIKQSLNENQNPPFQMVSTNFFAIRFYPRIARAEINSLSQRQVEILRLLHASKQSLSSAQLAEELRVSTTTVFREIRKLIDQSLVDSIGVGKATRYVAS